MLTAQPVQFALPGLGWALPGMHGRQAAWPGLFWWNPAPQSVQVPEFWASEMRPAGQSSQVNPCPESPTFFLPAAQAEQAALPCPEVRPAGQFEQTDAWESE